jgi:hypothetical protein
MTISINFPSRPPTGQKFPDPALPNAPVWQWNGTAWVQISGGGGGGSGAASSITFAPGGNIAATDVQAAILELDTEKAPIASPTFTGDPKAPTPTVGDNDTSIATTAFVAAAVTAAGSAAQVVRYDIAQTLTASQQTQARSNIYAAPLDALSFSGMQVNGSCEVSQERGSTSFGATISAWNFVQDGWRFFYTSAPLVMSAFPQLAGGPAGFGSCLAIQATTPKAALAASDTIILEQPIEGYRAARLVWGSASAQPVSIGFWVNSQSMVGTMTVVVFNNAANRSYATNIVINAVNTWEYKTLTVPGDTTGTWTRDNTAGLIIRFCFGAGSSQQAAVGSWLGTATVSGSAATTNFFAAANTCLITGLVVLPGLEVPSAARSALIMRPYDQELITCRRYYEKMGITTSNSIAAAMQTGFWTAEKRALPTLTWSVDVGSGAAYATVNSTPSKAFYQNAAHSQIATATITGDARL